MGDKLKKLDDESINDVAGGYIFDTRDYDIARPDHWEVIDNDGNVVSRHERMWQAEDAAIAAGLSPHQLSVQELEQLRGTGGL